MAGVILVELLGVLKKVGAYGESLGSVRANNHGSDQEPLQNPVMSRLYSPIMDNTGTPKALESNI